MARKRLSYFLFSKNKKPLYEDENGFVKEGDENYLKPNGEDACLEFSPEGWNDQLIKFGRNITYWGMFRDFTVSMKFVRDGYKILKKLYSEGWIEAFCLMGIQKLHPTMLPYTYQPYYLTEINFAKYRETSNREVRVEGLEGGMAKLFKANENTVYTIPIDSDPKHVNLYHDGMSLTGKKVYLLPFKYLATVHNASSMFATELNQEGASIGIDLFESNYEDMYLFFDYLENSQNYVAKAKESNTDPIDLIIKLDYKLKLLTKRDDEAMRMRFVKSPLANPSAITYYEIFWTVVDGGPYTFEGEVRHIVKNITIPLDPGDRVFMYTVLGGGIGFGDPGDWELLDGSQMSIEFTNRAKPSYIKGFHLYRLFELLVEKLIENKTILSVDGVFVWSNWLKNKKDIIITSGDAIRGIEGSVIKMSIADFFKSLNHWCPALSINGTRLTIEKFEDYFSEEVIADLGEVSDAEHGPAEDLLFNTLIAGGPKVDYNDVNGKQEFTQKSQWTTNITKVIAELDITTPTRKDPVGAELIRINLEGKTTTDSDSDSDNFMFNTLETPETNEEGLEFYRLYRPVYSHIEGVIDTSGIYNTELSIKRSIINNGRKIRSLTNKIDNTVLSLASGEKNTALLTQGGPYGITIDEDTPIQIGNLGDRIFLPEYITFKTKIPLSLLEILNSNPYGKILFRVKGRPFYGFLFDGGVRPATNDSQSWKLLSSKENDFSKFNEPL